MSDIETLLLSGLKEKQQEAVKSSHRRVLVVAGAGSGKTEIMARRIAWLVGVEGVPKDSIVAFTFTDRAAEEMKFRIRAWIERTTSPGEELSLGGMYIGTIHSFCISRLRQYWPDSYHNFDILDEGARMALILREFNGLLELLAFQRACGKNRGDTLKGFLAAYDQLHEHNKFAIKLPDTKAPYEPGREEREWCSEATLTTYVGQGPEFETFATSAARYYAYLHCRRFLDFSTSQSEFVSKLASDTPVLDQVRSLELSLVVDEVQDVNPVQRQLIDQLVGNTGRLTVVGDHRQAIYGFRGAKVEIIADLWEEFRQADDAEIVELAENFRSTPRIVNIANRWAKTIGGVRSMTTPPMTHGQPQRVDQHESHIALISFPDRPAEAAWIVRAIQALVPSEDEGAVHDRRDGSARGLTLSDIAVLVRSSTDVRTYMHAFEAARIPAIVRAGPDLFSQPEILFFVASLAITAGIDEFIGSPIDQRSMPNRIAKVLDCDKTPEAVLLAAGKLLRTVGLPLSLDVEERVLHVSRMLRKRIQGLETVTPQELVAIRTPSLREFLRSKNTLRRVFPQQIYQWLISEADVSSWDCGYGRGESALFHLGALSKLITGMETPGWTSVKDYQWQVIGLLLYGSERGKVEEQPLMVQPEAVTISTIHGAKGLEYAAVFLADVNPQRFPSSYARRKDWFPLSGPIVQEMDVESLSDNDNYDGERRLMYVGITRAERFLFVSSSGARNSLFVKELRSVFAQAGARVTSDSEGLLDALKYSPKEYQRTDRIATSFSDLRYYLECPHDFYLRKVLGFAPTIDQAFGYGRGVHNLLRAIHTEPGKWAELASNRSKLEAEIGKLLDSGLFYLRYTVGEPASNMREKGLRVVADYIERYAGELSRLTFEPEREFETLIHYADGSGGALINGAIDVIRRDDPPQVTLIDFKSGNPESDAHLNLDKDEMRLQVALYAIAAKKELEYEPERGLVRYLDVEGATDIELNVSFDQGTLEAAREKVSSMAQNIQNRQFNYGPSGPPKNRRNTSRCAECDFSDFCGQPDAQAFRKNRQ